MDSKLELNYIIDCHWQRNGQLEGYGIIGNMPVNASWPADTVTTGTMAARLGGVQGRGKERAVGC
jgi:hypothetical protein